MPRLTVSLAVSPLTLFIISTLLLHHQFTSGVRIDPPPLPRLSGSHRPTSPSTSSSSPAASSLPSPSTSSASPTPPPAACRLLPSPSKSSSSPAASTLPWPSTSSSPSAACSLLPSPSTSSSSPAASSLPSPSTSSSSLAPSPSVNHNRGHDQSHTTKLIGKVYTYTFGAMGVYLLAVTFFGTFWPYGLRLWELLLQDLLDWYRTSQNRFLVILRHNIHAVYVFGLAALIVMIIIHSIWPDFAFLGKKQTWAPGLEDLERLVKTIAELLGRR